MMPDSRLSQIPGIPIHQPNLTTLDDLQASIEATSVAEYQEGPLSRKASKTEELQRLEDSARDLVAKASELHATASQCSSSRGPSSVAPSFLSPMLPKASIHTGRASRRPLSIASDMPSVFSFPTGQDRTDVDFFVQKTNWEILRNDATQKLDEVDFEGAMDSLEKIDNADLKFQPDEATRLHIKRELAFCYLVTDNWEKAEPIIKYITATQPPSPALAQMQHAIAIGHYSKQDFTRAHHAWAHSMQSKEFLISMGRMHKTDLYDTWDLMANIQLAQGDEILAKGWRERVLDDAYLTQSLDDSSALNFALNNDHLVFGVLSLSLQEFKRRRTWLQTRNQMNRQLSFNRTGRNGERLDVTSKPPSSPENQQQGNAPIKRSASFQSVFNRLNRLKSMTRRGSLRRSNSAPETVQPITELSTINISTKPNVISGIVRTWQWSRRSTKKTHGKIQQPRFDLTDGTKFETPIEQSQVQRVTKKPTQSVQWLMDKPDISKPMFVVEIDGREIGNRNESSASSIIETSTEMVDDWETQANPTPLLDMVYAQQEPAIGHSQLPSPSLVTTIPQTEETVYETPTSPNIPYSTSIPETAHSRPPSPDLYSPATPRIVERVNTIDMDEPPPLLRMESLESSADSADGDPDDELPLPLLGSELDQQWRQELIDEYSREKKRYSGCLDNGWCDIQELDGEDTMVAPFGLIGAAELCINDDTG